jgi:hypothetical protein
MIIKLLEILRIACSATGMYLAYASNSPTNSLFWLVALVAIPLAGLTGIESLFFSRQAAIAKDREINSDYQTQSGCNNLATATAGLIILSCKLGPAAQIAIILVLLLFFTFSSMKHAIEYFIDRKSGIHLQRFILTALLLGFCIPILIKAWP